MTDIVGSSVDCVDRAAPHQGRPDGWRQTVHKLAKPRLENNCEYTQLNDKV